MADKHEEAARKEALAAKYADIVRKREETLKERLSNAQYDFFKNQEEPGDQTIYSRLETRIIFLLVSINSAAGGVENESIKDSFLYLSTLVTSPS